MYTVEIEAITEITPAAIAQLKRVYESIPEFENSHSSQDISDRLLSNPALLLIAKVEGEIAGFKLGYQLSDDVFYSWLGGISPDFRGLGLAKSMLEYQESWASQQGYSQVEVKTRNCFPRMLKMLINSQYQITAMTPDQQQLSQHKLHLQKQL
ncbi:GCN5-like N-acetyltransferase [Shewanella piezotolerans WP3]|uniref:GCN5-like N-acetyltransferase n=1 Tax=Shewanella piezotolerans (strain WP3 / JCM 13877) TaxID=225849 RepID=B8CVB4_SHEPW|nr:GCN5-like N-acetyltransferase [Shewanella piezotolerans WP3]